jgi:hypothetical protein
MDCKTKAIITGGVIWTVGPVASHLLSDIYEGLPPHGSPVPFVFALPGATSTVSSSTAAMMVVDKS